ncbi:hypothetical protein G7009_00095 [Pseudomonas capeferrum]|uniref:hypothetical protein n=1 Tax=Pseudomonas capeferrum TaxID=1495066 RepID=UPI0015E47279|nr:hypothetical protein [Pseudomonas capeferrum]MBA1200207.1 hypothetical protein [Pseudomonas capeferrum]
MKALVTIWISCAVLAASTTGCADTPDDRCSERPQTYQERYEHNKRAGDFICYEKALEREMSNGTPDACSNSAESYQAAYQKRQRSSDFLCYQKALARERR